MAQTFNQYPDVAKGVPIIYGVRLTYDSTYEYRYVGLTSAGSKRFRDHLYDAANPNSASYLYPKSRWMRKHNYNVTFDILEVVEDVQLLPLSEVKWMHILKSRGHRLLNVTEGGVGAWGYRHTEEFKTKMSRSYRGEGHPAYGKKHTEETKAKMSRAHRNMSSETRAKMSASRTGKSMTKEARDKMSKSKMGNKNWVGKNHSKETKAKMSASLSGIPKSPEHKARLAEAAHTQWHTRRGLTKPECRFCQ